MLYKLLYKHISAEINCNGILTISKTESNVASYQGPHLTCFIKAGVPPGSILWHLLFLVFINDVEGINSSTRLFADDSSL